MNSNYEQQVLKCFSCVNQRNISIQNEVQAHLFEMFLCPLCGNEPQYYKSYNGSKDVSPYVHFNCHSCRYQWMLCRICSHKTQPSLLSKRDQRRNVKNVYGTLHNMMKEHTKNNHINNDHSQYFTMPQEESLFGFDANSNDVYAEDNSLNSNENFLLMEHLKETFPNDDSNVNRNKKIGHLRTLIYKKISQNSYTEHLILDKWLSLNSNEYSISKEDCDLFLRIVRQILLNSRDEQMKIVDIYSRIEKRNLDEILSLRKHIDQLTETINRQKEVIASFCDQFEINELNSVTDITSITPVDNLFEVGKSLCVNKLTLPSTLKDARIITDRFLSGLICPSICKNSEVGYAYVLPSDILPIAIASGLQFEHMHKDPDDINIVNQRSIFQASYVKRIVKEIKKKLDNESSITTTTEPESTLLVPLGLWSDGCDAGSASKANRNLVKLTTLHFVNPNIKEEHVFPIALGEHNANHNYVRNKLMEDLYHLTKAPRKCYVPSLKKNSWNTIFRCVFHSRQS